LRPAAFAAVFAHRYDAATRFIATIERSADIANPTGDDEISAIRLMRLGWTDQIPEVLGTVVTMRCERSRLGPFAVGPLSNASGFCHIALGR
jgi:LuxR family transcriptional regulator, maltose regulon positive regulatory protein